MGFGLSRLIPYEVGLPKERPGHLFRTTQQWNPNPNSSPGEYVLRFLGSLAKKVMVKSSMIIFFFRLHLVDGGLGSLYLWRFHRLPYAMTAHTLSEQSSCETGMPCAHRLHQRLWAAKRGLGRMSQMSQMSQKTLLLAKWWKDDLTPKSIHDI